MVTRFQLRRYPESKERELTEDEKRQLRERIERGDGDIYGAGAGTRVYVLASRGHQGRR